MPLNWSPNIDNLRRVESPVLNTQKFGAAPERPAYPPNYDPYLRTSLPAIFQYQPDSLRQFFQRGIPQGRVPQIQLNAQTNFNASFIALNKQNAT